VVAVEPVPIGAIVVVEEAIPGFVVADSLRLRKLEQKLPPGLLVAVKKI
jgi:hypothetical protein